MPATFLAAPTNYGSATGSPELFVPYLVPQHRGFDWLGVTENRQVFGGEEHLGAARRRFDAASQFSHTALEQRVSPSASFHVGVRGSTYRSSVMERTCSLGYNVITMREFMRRGEADVLAEIHETMKGRPVDLSWDMDSFDPSVAPAVGAGASGS